MEKVDDELIPSDHTVETEHDMEPDNDTEDISDEEYPYKEDTPSGKVFSHDTRPALTISDKPADAILDVSEDGIFKDMDLMESFFPSIRKIITGEVDAKSLTINEVNDLSRYSLAKALFTDETYNPIKGLLDNQLHHPENGTFGSRISKPKLSSEGSLSLADISSLGVSISGGGIITYKLVNSGFTVRIKPLDVNDEIKLEESITHRISELGRSTIGGGILAMDAIIIDVILDMILDNVIEHNIKDNGKGELSDNSKLRDLISFRDIRPLVAVMNAIMNLDGYNYHVPCVECKTLTSMNLNVIRSMNHDHGKLSRGQLDQLLLPLKSKISIKDIRKYQEQFESSAMSNKFVINGMEYIVHLRSGSINDKMTSYGLLFNLLEKLARELVTETGPEAAVAIDDKCKDMLHRLWHLQYLPAVAYIEIKIGDVYRRADTPETILEFLKIISMSDAAGELAKYLTEFMYDSVVTFATHVPKCPSCGHEHDDVRYYDPVIDFFIRRMSHTISTSIVQEVMNRS